MWYDGATVTVTGDETGHNVAVSADTGGVIHIGGSVTGSGIGVSAISATVEITGGVTASGSDGCGNICRQSRHCHCGVPASPLGSRASRRQSKPVTVAGDIIVTIWCRRGRAVIAETSSKVYGLAAVSVMGGALGVSAETGGDIDIHGEYQRLLLRYRCVRRVPM
jgi:hypothetical protein